MSLRADTAGLPAAPSGRRTPIGRPGDRHLTFVDEFGSLIYTNASDRSGRVVRFGLPEQPVDVEQFMGDPRAPIVTPIVRYARCQLELVAFCHVDATGCRLDLVRWRVLGPAGSPGGRPTLRVEAFGTGPVDPVLVADAPLATETMISGAFVFVLDAAGVDGDRRPAGWIDEALDHERRYWAEFAQRTNELHVPDRRVMRMLEAAPRLIARALAEHRAGFDDRALIEAATILGLDDQARTVVAPAVDEQGGGLDPAAIDRLERLAADVPPTGPTTEVVVELVRLVRDLVVFERAGELELLAGLPAGWLIPGAQVVVRRTPTRFGPLSLRMSVDDAGVANLDIDADFVQPPERVLLRSPASAAWVRVDGQERDPVEGLIPLPVTRRIGVSIGLGAAYGTVAGHAAVKAALRDWRAFSSSAPFKPDLRSYHQLPIESDPPAHTAYRSLLTQFFTRQRVVALEPELRAVASELVGHLRAEGRAEVVHDLVLPMVVRSLGAVLGRPQDADEWLSWGLRNNEPHGRRDSRRTEAYLARVFDEVEQRPGADAFSHLTRTQPDGRPLTRSERLGFGSLLLTAGRAAVVNLICGAAEHLATNASARARLAADPSLIPTAIDEYLRYLSPVPQMPRLATADAGEEAGARPVAISFLSANHDPVVFAEPDTIDLDRRPNRHLAFGNGPHFCIGANLGKLEAQLLLEELLRVVPDFTPDGESELAWESVAGVTVPGEYTSLPIAVSR